MSKHDITKRYRQAAQIAEMVARAPGMSLTRYCYVMIPILPSWRWRLAVCRENDEGYRPVPGKTFQNLRNAVEWAAGLNQHLGLTSKAFCEIVASTAPPHLRHGVVRTLECCAPDEEPTLH